MTFVCCSYITRITTKLLVFTELLTHAADGERGDVSSADWTASESAFGLLEASGQVCMCACVCVCVCGLVCAVLGKFAVRSTSPNLTNGLPCSTVIYYHWRV
jgi:hypothetical protein